MRPFFNRGFLLFFLALSLCGRAQQSSGKKENSSRLGLKLGYNSARLAGTPVNLSFRSASGFMAAGFFSTRGRGFGYRSELVFSRQGYSFDDSGKRQEVQTDYVYLPQLTTFTIGKVFQVQAGGQIGYLLRSSAETDDSARQDLSKFMNRLDYGAAFGFEIYPVRGFLLGARYNLSFGHLYEQQPSSIMSPLPFDPSEVKGRNAVLQIFVGYRF